MAKITHFPDRTGVNNSNYKHGLQKHPLYAIHSEMRARCNRESHPRYKDYGGRGIKVCDEWNSFLTFYTWAVENGWELGLEIDRKDNDGWYSPDNCRIVPQEINARNTRRCRQIEYNGKTQTLAEWARELNLNYFMLLTRIHKHQMSAPELFEKPNRYCKHKNKLRNSE